MTSGIKKSHKQILEELENVLKDDFIIIGKYTGVKNPIRLKHFCNKCKNFEFEYKNAGAFLSKINKGKIKNENLCPICSGKIRKRDNNIIDLLIFYLVGDEYTRISDYTGKNNEHIILRHNCEECDNHEWPANLSHFLSRINPRRCPKCANIHKNDKYRKTPEEFKNEFELLVGNEYTLLTDYGRNNKQKVVVMHNCEECNNFIYAVRPNDFLGGKRCPKCAGTYKKTTEEFKEELDLLFGVDSMSVLGEYINKDTKIKLRHNCSICSNHEWETTPHNILHNVKYGCPECARIIKESKAVNIIKILLAENEIDYEIEMTYKDCKYKSNLKFDFVFDNIHMEYDGSQHFKNGYGSSKEEKEDYVLLQHSRDSVKNDYCLNNNLTLIRIPYTEEPNLEIILDSIINYNEETLINHNCLIIKDGNLVNQPNIYSWYKPNTIILNEENKE